MKCLERVVRYVVFVCHPHKSRVFRAFLYSGLRWEVQVVGMGNRVGVLVFLGRILLVLLVVYESGESERDTQPEKLSETERWSYTYQKCTF